ETLASDRRDEQVDLLAQHAVRGQVWDKALQYCRQAGAKAVAGSAYPAAGGDFGEALEAPAHLSVEYATIEPKFHLRVDLSMSLMPLEQYEQALTCLHDAKTLAEELGDQRRLGRVCQRIGNTLRQMQDYAPSLAYLQQAHAMATALGDVDLQGGGQSKYG